MSVDVDPSEDEAEEFVRVYEVMREQGGFGRNKKGPPFCVSFQIPLGEGRGSQGVWKCYALTVAMKAISRETAPKN